MPRHQTVPESGDQSLPGLWEWCRRLGLALNGLLLGRSNNVYTLTLAASATSTVLSDTRITADTVALMEPTTAAAVTALLAGIRQSAAPGAITFTHASNAATDQTFRLALVG